MPLVEAPPRLDVSIKGFENKEYLNSKAREPLFYAFGERANRISFVWRKVIYRLNKIPNNRAERSTETKNRS